jgi:Rrf2 family protein
MIKISKKMEYALMALELMGRKKTDEITSVREICKTCHAPFDPVSKALQAMSNADFVDSVQGVKGGYLLKKSLSKITFRELSELINGPSPHISCIHGKCGLSRQCPIMTPMKRLNERMNDFFSSITLEDLLGNRK